MQVTAMLDGVADFSRSSKSFSFDHSAVRPP